MTSTTLKYWKRGVTHLFVSSLSTVICLPHQTLRTPYRKQQYCDLLDFLLQRSSGQNSHATIQISIASENFPSRKPTLDFKHKWWIPLTCITDMQIKTRFMNLLPLTQERNKSTIHTNDINRSIIWNTSSFCFTQILCVIVSFRDNLKYLSFPNFAAQPMQGQCFHYEITKTNGAAKLLKRIQALRKHPVFKLD